MESDDDTVFLYNRREGVITEPNGLYYMRARYYYPEFQRFISPDTRRGSIENAVTLNRFAYANCNPVMNVDPTGHSAERGSLSREEVKVLQEYLSSISYDSEQFNEDFNKLTAGNLAYEFFVNEDTLTAVYNAFKHANEITTTKTHASKRLAEEALKEIEELYGPSSLLAKTFKVIAFAEILYEAGIGFVENQKNGESDFEIVSDISIDVNLGVFSALVSTAFSAAATGFVAGSVAPGVGNLIGAAAGLVGAVGGVFYH